MKMEMIHDSTGSVLMAHGHVSRLTDEIRLECCRTVEWSETPPPRRRFVCSWWFLRRSGSGGGGPFPRHFPCEVGGWYSVTCYIRRPVFDWCIVR